MTLADYGARIRFARETHGLNQVDLGKRLHPPVSQAAVSRMERGLTLRSMDTLRLLEIAGITGRTLTWLEGEEE